MTFSYALVVIFELNSIKFIHSLISDGLFAGLLSPSLQCRSAYVSGPGPGEMLSPSAAPRQ